MNHRLLLFCLALICTGLSCGESDLDKKYKDVYKSSTGHYTLVKYYTRANHQHKVLKRKLRNYPEYYEVHYDIKTNLPIKEKYHIGGQMKWEKKYHYKKNQKGQVKLKNTSTYNLKGKKTKEEILYNGKPYIVILFFYHNTTGFLSHEQRFKNGLKDGWWIRYNNLKRVSRKENYVKGKLDSYWIYYYTATGKVVKEEKFNGKGKRLYVYKF